MFEKEEYKIKHVTTVINKNMIKLIYLLIIINNIDCQQPYGYQDPYNFQARSGEHWIRLNPGDKDYRTYEYNGRRYGQSFPVYDPRYSDPNHPNFNRNFPNYQPGHPNYNPNYNFNDPNFRYPVSDNNG